MCVNKIVDVIIPSYNRLDLIVLSIDSIKNQTYPVNKIIVIDDNSEYSVDLFWEKLKEHGISPEGITFHRKNTNRGACHSRNLGASLSNAEFIAFLDDDDVLESNHIESLMKCFTSEDIALVYSGKIIKNYSNGKMRQSLNVIPETDQYLALLKCNYPGSTSSIIVRKKIFIITNGFDESLPAIQDYDFYLRVVKHGGITTSGSNTLIYRNDTAVKITNQLDKARKAFFIIISKTEPSFKKILATTIFYQNIKKAILNKKPTYLILFCMDFLKFILKSK